MTTPFPFTIGQVLTAAQLNAITELVVNDKTASHTLTAADAGDRVIMNSASATTITVNTSVFTAGQVIYVTNKGAGVCTITAGTATVSTTGTLALSQFASGVLYCISAGVFLFEAYGVAAVQEFAIFREEQASGTFGGTATSGSFATRTLNTTVVNDIAGCSLASSEVTLAAGTYRVTGYAPGANGVGFNIARIQNITDSSTVAGGMNGQQAGGGTTIFAFIDTIFTLAASKAIALQQRVQTTVATDGLGNRINVAGITEVYSTFIIQRLA